MQIGNVIMSKLGLLRAAGESVDYRRDLDTKDAAYFSLLLGWPVLVLDILKLTKPYIKFEFEKCRL